MDKESRAIIAWLQRQPLNAAIEWASDHCTREEPWACGWIDIHVPAICTELKLNWLWTIVGPDDLEEDLDAEALWGFVVPYDIEEYAVYDPEPPTVWFIGACCVPVGQPLDPANEERLAALVAAGPNRSRSMRRGWSATAVSAALTAWAAEHAERPDLRFVWNPDLGVSPMLAQAEESSARVERGEEALHNLGDGMEASEQVMNFFLEDPDRAAQILRDFKREVRGDPAGPSADIEHDSV